MPKRIFVHSTLPVRRDGGSAVAFTEIHPDHVAGMSDEDLPNVKNIGEKTLADIRKLIPRAK